MTPDLEYIQSAFDRYNALCFGGVLPGIRLELSRARSYLGRYEEKRPQIRFLGRRISVPTAEPQRLIRISAAFDLTPDQQDDVIIHEMIHYYLAWKGLADRVPHGPHFRQLSEAINSKFGRHIVVRYKMGTAGRAGGPAAKRASRRIICVSQLRSGEWGITVCATTRVFYLRRNLPRYYSIKSSQWYSTTDAFFSRYPRSNTPKIYRISLEELEQHLQGAVRMAFKGRFFGPEESE